jgi:hypothetical protein
MTLLMAILLTIAPNTLRPGVFCGFALDFPSTPGLTPVCTGGGLWANGTLLSTAVQPTLPAAPANQRSWLFYNSSTGWYWQNSTTPVTAGDAGPVGWVVTNGSQIIELSRQVIEIGDPSAQPAPIHSVVALALQPPPAVRPPVGFQGESADEPWSVNLDGRELLVPAAVTAVTASDGTTQQQVAQTYYSGPNTASVLTNPPVVGSVVVDTTGAVGSLYGPSTLFYSVAAIDANGYRSPIGATLKVTLGGSGAVNGVQLQGLAFDANAVQMAVYRGRDPLTMVSIYVGLVASTHTDTGSIGGSTHYPPVDLLLDHLNVRSRAVQSTHGGILVAANPGSPSTTTLVCNSAPFSAGDVGRWVEFASGNAAAAFDTWARISAYTTPTQVTIDQSLAIPDGTQFAMYYQATSVSTSTISDSTAAWTTNQWAGFRVRIVNAGTQAMRYQEALIASNTSTALTIAGSWDVTPDTTCGFEIVDGSWSPSGTVVATDIFSDVTRFRAAATLPNVTGLYEIQARMATVAAVESNYDLTIVTRLAVTGVALSSSGLPLVPLSKGGTSQDNTGITINKVFAGPASGSTGSATFRSLVDADLPIVDRAHGGTQQDNNSVPANQLFAGPTSGSPSLAAFRAMVAADLPALTNSNLPIVDRSHGGTQQDNNSVPANQVYAGPTSGSPSAAFFRFLSAADVASFLQTGSGLVTSGNSSASISFTFASTVLAAVVSLSTLGYTAAVSWASNTVTVYLDSTATVNVSFTVLAIGV